MKTTANAMLVAFALLVLAESVMARTPWGNNCTGCHTVDRPGLVQLTRFDFLADPYELYGAVDLETQEVVRVRPGDVVNLSAVVSGLSDNDEYGFAVLGVRGSGVQSDGALAGMPDCTWPERWQSGTFYFPEEKYTWPHGYTEEVFEITVDPDATPDYYALTFVTAGWSSVDGSLFYSEDHLYLRIVPEETPDTDINGDGPVDLVDFAAIQAAMTGPGQPTTSDAADLDDDNDCDLRDVVQFIQDFTG